MGPKRHGYGADGNFFYQERAGRQPGTWRGRAPPGPRRSVVALLREREVPPRVLPLADRTSDRSTARAGIVPPPCAGKVERSPRVAAGRPSTGAVGQLGAQDRDDVSSAVRGRPHKCSSARSAGAYAKLRPRAEEARAACHPGTKGCELTARDRSWIIPR
jgi:hypothetical protein